MEALVAMAVLGFFIKRGVVDTAAVATGRTPPSHAYRMAKLTQKQQKQQQEATKDSTTRSGRWRDVTKDPDTRGGLWRVVAHWYRDACEDLDEFRANRRLSRPQRKAAKQARKQRRDAVIAKATQATTQVATAVARRARAAAQDPDQPDQPAEQAQPAGQDADAVPQQVPPLPDNVVPLARPAGGGPGPAAGPKDPAQAGVQQKPGNGNGGPAMGDDLSASDESGLAPHLRALSSAQQRCERIIANTDRIRAQMQQAGMGEQVTGEAGTVTDTTRSAQQSIGAAAQVVEDLNRQVLEALAGSGYQAAEKDYLTPENA